MHECQVNIFQIITKNEITTSALQNGI